MNVILDHVVRAYPSGFRMLIDRLQITSGERVGLVGNNGAGKTTLLLALLGLLRTDAGRIWLGKADVQQRRAWRYRTASYLGDSSVIPFLSPVEYWEFVSAAYGISKDEAARRLKSFDGFIDAESTARKKLIREYSQGNRKKIGLVAAMLVRPSLLVLDEPFANLDPISHACLEESLRSLHHDSGTTVIVSSHNLAHVVDLCTRILVIDDGRIVRDAPSSAETLQNVRSFLTSRH